LEDSSTELISFSQFFSHHRSFSGKLNLVAANDSANTKGGRGGRQELTIRGRPGWTSTQSAPPDLEEKSGTNQAIQPGA